MKIALAALLAAAILLSGCSQNPGASDSSDRADRTGVSDPSGVANRTSGPATGGGQPSLSSPSASANGSGPVAPEGNYRCDPYRFYANLTDPAYYADACRLVDAIAGYQDFLSVDDPEVAAALADNIFYNYPPAALCTFTTEDGGIRIGYENEREKHLKKIADFYSKVEGILNSTVDPSMSKLQIALELYRYTATHVSYFTVDYTPADTSAYSAITRGVTICYGYADCFNYLLRQAGIEAELLRGYRAGDFADHGWSLVKLDGVWYHCDATWECSGTGGEGLTYFGMSDRTRFSTLANDAVSGFGSLEARYPGNLATNGRLDAVIHSNPRYYYGPWEYESLAAALDG